MVGRSGRADARRARVQPGRGRRCNARPNAISHRHPARPDAQPAGYRHPAVRYRHRHAHAHRRRGDQPDPGRPYPGQLHAADHLARVHGRRGRHAQPHRGTRRLDRRPACHCQLPVQHGLDLRRPAALRPGAPGHPDPGRHSGSQPTDLPRESGGPTFLAGFRQPRRDLFRDGARQCRGSPQCGRGRFLRQRSGGWPGCLHGSGC